MSSYICLSITIALVMGTVMAHAEQPLKPVPLTAVRFTDDFWAPRLETNRRVTIPHNFRMCEKTGRIANFARAGGLEEGGHQGIYFDDSDVYKAVEAAACSLATHPDPELDSYLDELIAKFTAAQREDGYLYTFNTLKGLDKRFTNLRDMHELYCAGHLIEAAVAHHEATGKRSLLDIAVRLADHIDSIFGPGKRHDVDGHQEIEIALFRLADATGDEKYRRLGEFFVDERGRSDHRKLYGPYFQDHVPVTQATEVTGHAVRQMYHLCAATDMALRGSAAHRKAVDRLWEQMVSQKMYITGGVGARHEGESFGEPFELPNDSAYAETCAGIGSALWSHRMNLMHADGKYFDEVERVLYNGFLSSVSLSGDRFFYVNPLASRGRHHRQEWYSCACCPPNIARFMAQLPRLAYAVGEQSDVPHIYVNIYATGEADIELQEAKVRLVQQTRYPWDGKVAIKVHVEPSTLLAIKLRIPGWCEGASVKVNGNDQPINIDSGYVTLEGTWHDGDVIELNLPMPIRRARSDPRVQANIGRVAIQRGPVVYCVEAIDHGGRVSNLVLPPDAKLSAEHRSNLFDGVTVIRGKALARGMEDQPVRELDLLMIPYYAWDHRDPGEMAVWIAEELSVARALPPATIATMSRASASHVNPNDTVDALNDEAPIRDSNDHSIPRFTWWSRKGSAEWVQYDFASRATVSQVQVYWFDDGRSGGHCRVPQSWRVLWRDGEQWKPVQNSSDYATSQDEFNVVRFDAVTTGALRIEVELQPGHSAGILEWRVE